MNVQELQNRIKQLNNANFQSLLSWVVTSERERRAAQPAVERAQADLVTELQDAGKLEKPAAATEEQAREDAGAVPEWRDPGTDHAKMYHYGDVVQYEGRLVRSTHQGLNHWRPGTLSFDGRIWEDITPTGEEDTPSEDSPAEDTNTAPEWAPGVAYIAGEEITHQGRRYRVLQAHTSQEAWAPDAAHSLFQEVVS